ncbi:RNA polymerase sigma factor [Sphingobacterium faecium]|uniref:RNA polymerase sigma factor n=1 Tax=Sphingobacterium faecium TaxID=34087 RepID=UPI0024695AA8|nr:sigma-70 family RNA polymerase sigma factor [Sphingobacterium faecium]MDH5826288.1 sigma-70 family RNA polymerase sigma factor [Sphingobacterium faecium]
MKNRHNVLLGNDELLKRLRERDLEAFNVVYDDYWSLLLNISLKRLDDPLICEEIVQDVFVELWQSCTHREIYNLEAYLITCVKYKIFEAYKKSKKLKSNVLKNDVFFKIEEAFEEDRFAEKDLISLIEKWIAHLPQKRKEIFKMRFLDGLTVKEISDVTENSPNTIKNHLGISINKLRLMIKQNFLIFILILFNCK